MNLKYQKQIEEFSECEVSNCTAQERLAYRWVFENIIDSRNFLPRYLQPVYENQEKTSCLGYALSMFDSADQAKSRLETLVKGKAFLYKKLGTHLATGVIKPTDGISNTAGSDGHFSCFEFETTDFSSTFVITQELYQRI